MSDSSMTAAEITAACGMTADEIRAVLWQAENAEWAAELPCDHKECAGWYISARRQNAGLGFRGLRAACLLVSS